jgi:hypothetical protein
MCYYKRTSEHYYTITGRKNRLMETCAFKQYSQYPLMAYSEVKK